MEHSADRDMRRDTGYAIWDTGCGMRDAGCGMRKPRVLPWDDDLSGSARMDRELEPPTPVEQTVVPPAPDLPEGAILSTGTPINIYAYRAAKVAAKLRANADPDAIEPPSIRE